jgi:hypothetical protein
VSGKSEEVSVPREEVQEESKEAKKEPKVEKKEYEERPINPPEEFKRRDEYREEVKEVID